MFAQGFFATCVLPALLVLSVSACGCEPVFDRTLEVQVMDARTGAWTAEGAVGVLAMGDSAEPLRVIGFSGSPPNDTATTLGSGDVARLGMYRVVITKAGYLPWEHVGVVREG